MIAYADRIAGSMRALISSRFHVEHDDLAGAAILGAIQGRPMKYAVIDEIRKIGGRGHGNLVDPVKHRRVFQLHEDYDRAAHPKCIVGLALKRCGVIMLEFLKAIPKNPITQGGAWKFKPELRYNVIMLRYWHQLNQRETADQLGLSQERIGQIEREACKLIRAELERRGIKSLRDVV